jgi:tetratricopeptide (TPR) repeat protein
MFFTRLRRHAKWMFVLLALIFGLGFIIFGIGSDQGTGIGDILRNSGGATGNNLSVSEAREQLQKSPTSAKAQRDLATALQTDGKSNEAITYLTLYVDQRPRDQDALRELASLHLSEAITKAQEAQEAQLHASYVTFGTTFGGSLELGEGGQTLGPDPIDQAISTQASQAVNTAFAAAQEAFQAAEQTYDKLVLAAPNDPNVQLELAQAAQQGGNYAKAIASYERFLQLAPDDPSAPIVKQQIAQLKQAQTPAGSG